MREPGSPPRLRPRTWPRPQEPTRQRSRSSPPPPISPDLTTNGSLWSVPGSGWRWRGRALRRGGHGSWGRRGTDSQGWGQHAAASYLPRSPPRWARRAAARTPGCSRRPAWRTRVPARRGLGGADLAGPGSQGGGRPGLCRIPPDQPRRRQALAISYGSPRAVSRSVDLARCAVAAIYGRREASRPRRPRSHGAAVLPRRLRPACRCSRRPRRRPGPAANWRGKSTAGEHRPLPRRPRRSGGRAGSTRTGA